MSVFTTYLELGFHHIFNASAFDHILFIIALCAVYKVEQWKKILLMVTAFTIGHSITLALAVLDVFSVESKYVEFVIPITILLTAIINLFQKSEHGKGRMGIRYVVAVVFGLVHGMAFAGLIGNAEVLPLVGFNLGIELGQLLIVLLMMIALMIGINILRIRQREWNVFLSGAAAGVAVLLIFENKFW